MGDPYKRKIAGHSLVSGRRANGSHCTNATAYEAVCECGAKSPILKTISERVAWHQQHKGDKLDDFVSRGCDDRGREVHL